MKKRKYLKTRRADQQDLTRDRIVEATVALHEELGPAYTSIKAIAEKAGVQRLTVYRHFPDETSLFQACTSHYFGQHPSPMISQWNDQPDARERSRTALLAFCRYYRLTENMLTVAYRDVDRVEALHVPMAEFEAYIDIVRDDLLKAWNKKQESKKRLKITIRHGLSFSTWLSLKKQKLNDEKIADLIITWIDAGVGFPISH